jgi:hypothetical protein
LGEIDQPDDRHPRLTPRLLDDIASAAARIRQDHKADLDPATADRAARKFRLMLTPRRRKGRPRSTAVIIAIKLRRQGKQWKEIYMEAIAEFAKMDRAQRWYRCYNLRQNVNRIIKRSKAKTQANLEESAN